MRKILTATLAAAVMGAGVAQSATTTTTFAVTATVQSTCSATAPTTLSMCSSTDVISRPRCLDHFSKRRAALALRQPSVPSMFDSLEVKVLYPT